MDYELITSRINVRLVLTKVQPIYDFYLLYTRLISHYLLFLSMSLYHPKLVTWSYDLLLIASPYSLSHCPVLLFYTCMTFTLYLHVCAYYINNVFIFTKPIDNNSQVVQIDILLFRHSRNNRILCMGVCGFGRCA